MPGIENGRVVSDVNDDVICDLCNRVFVDPVANVCPHVFCHSCIKKRLQSKTTRECPTCSTPLNETPSKPPESIVDQLMRVRIKCPCNCERVLLVKDSDEHVRQECPNAPVPCPNHHLGCALTPKRHLVAKHVAECDFRYVCCDACGHRTLYKDLFTHQKHKRCLERKLRREVVKGLRQLNIEVESHRHEMHVQSVRAHNEEREQIRKHHSRHKLNNNSSGKSLNGSTSDVSGSESTSSVESSPRGGFCNSPRDDPRLKHCSRCRKYFNPNKNRPHACAWHQGPVLELFGGTCHTCGRLDVQKGCMTGYHTDALTEQANEDNDDALNINSTLE